MLDMGDPVRIADVARQLIEQSGTPVEIVYTGLRPGEKMHEELFDDDEPQCQQRRHPMVSHVPVPSVSEEEIVALPASGPADGVRRAMALLCATPAPLVDSVAAELVDYSTAK